MTHSGPCVAATDAYPSRPLALVLRPIVLTVVLSGWAWTGASSQAAEPEYEPDVSLVIKEKAFHVVKGNVVEDDSPHPGLSLSPGQDIILELRNEDKLPHEFVSPVFTQVEFQFCGTETLVYIYTVTGRRIERC